MNCRGVTLVELLITATIFILLATMVGVAHYTGIDTWFTNLNHGDLTAAARNSLENISTQISSSNISMIAIRPCNPEECLGQVLAVKVPIKDGLAIAGTIYTPNGTIKYGADGKQYCYYKYMVNPQHQLVRKLECMPGMQLCGDGACSGGETLSSCEYDCAVCGDGTCSLTVESAAICEDCASCTDGACTVGERCGEDRYCPNECGPCGGPIPPGPPTD